MKKSVITLIAIAAVVFLLGCWYVSKHNQIIDADQNVQTKFGELQNQMQRQADLIGNLVETVKGNAAFERGTFTEISEARSNVNAIAKMDPSKINNNPDLQKQLIEAQTKMSSAIVKLNAAREAYPDLKANDAFKSLMYQLEGTQNRITTARGRTQTSIQYYNGLIMKFPGSLAASGYAPKPYFQASEAAQTAPQVKFQ